MAVHYDFKVVSGRATKKEQKSIARFKAEDKAEYKHALEASNAKKSKRFLELILENYPDLRVPNLGKPIVDFVKGYDNPIQKAYYKKTKIKPGKAYEVARLLNGGYRHVYFPAQIKAGDLCFNSGYAVVLPKGKNFYGLLSELSCGREIADLNALVRQVDHIYNKIRHFVRAFDPSHKNEFFLAAPVYKKYHGRSMQLEEFLSGRLPAACFEKALSLAVVLSSDATLKRLKIKACLNLGYMLGKDKKTQKWARRESGGHAWVQLDVPYAAKKFGLKGGSYILDPSEDEIYILNDKTNRAYRKYIPLARKPLQLYLSLFRPKRY